MDGGPETGNCTIHQTLGHAALPSACQHFPRECLIDPRGVFVTLSHYCPTAAELLFTHSGPVDIVVGLSPIPDGHAEGLDARDVLPPLLTSGVLMDHAGYAAWEAHMIRTLAADDSDSSWRPPEQSLDLLEQHARTLARWRPGEATLADAVRDLPAQPHASAGAGTNWIHERRLFDIVRASLPATHAWPDIPRSTEEAWRPRGPGLG